MGKEEICLSGPEASKLKGIITAIDKLMARLDSQEDLALQATEFHEKVKSKGTISQYIMVALLPSRRSQGLFNFCYHYVEAEKGTTPEQLTAHLINNSTIGYDRKEQEWRYIMEGVVADLAQRVRSRCHLEECKGESSVGEPAAFDISTPEEPNPPRGSDDFNYSSRGS